MTSSSADWVFGEARLISSASTIEAKTGPLFEVELEHVRLVVDRDAGDVGRQQVGRELDAAEWVPCTVAASALASWVLPVPGASSSSTWPSASSAVSTSRITSGLPSTAMSDVVDEPLKVSANQVACSGVMVMRLRVVGVGFVGWYSRAATR